MNKPTRIILRLLMIPFLLCIILIRYNYAALKHAFLAVKYGGEWITYMEKDEFKTIQEIYMEIKDQRVSAKTEA